MSPIPPVTEYNKKKDEILTPNFQIAISTQTIKHFYIYEDAYYSSKKKSLNY